MTIHTNPSRAANRNPNNPQRIWLLCGLLLFSLSVAFWLQPAQAARLNDSALAIPRLSAGRFEQPGGQDDVASPLAIQADLQSHMSGPAASDNLSDFVAALDAQRTAQSLADPSGLEQRSLALSGLQVGNQPPVITQPDPQSGFPPTVPAKRHSVYLPLLFSGGLVAGISSDLPDPPFSCKNLQNFSGSREFPGQVQCQALLAFYASTQGDYWLRNDGWLRDTNPCRWYGVGCLEGIGIVSLALSNNGLFGHLPPEIGSLPLRTLDVSTNRLMGSLPEGLLETSSLQEVSLHSNRFQGSYPIDFMSLYDTSRGQTDRRREFTSNDFRRIDTSGYSCTGQGVSVSDCEALVAFFRSTGGEDPNSAYWSNHGGRWLLDTNPCNWGWVSCADGRVTQLSVPREISQGLNGTLPAELGNLAALTHLSIEGAGLSGSLPAEFGRLGNLRFLSITDSGLSGWLPGELGNLEKLEELDLAGNSLTGPIPASLGSLKSIRRIDLSRNDLSGEVPSALALVNTGTSIRFHTLALNDNPNLCVPGELGRFVSGLTVFSGSWCSLIER